MCLRGKRVAWLLLPIAIVALVAVALRPAPPLDDRLAAGASGQGSSSARATIDALAARSPELSGGPRASGGATPSPGRAAAESAVAATAAPPTGAPSTPGPATPTATPRITPAPPNPTPKPPTPPPPTPAPPTAGPIPPLSACPIFPASNVWNRRVDALPVAADSAAMIAAIGLGSSLHPDFSDAGGYGIPFNIVGSSTPRATVTFDYDDESDHVGYPIPTAPKIEGGSDRHLLMIDTDSCTLYELFAAELSGSAWQAGSGAVWALGSNALRPAGWTSADAAGLPIFPGLVRYAEVAAGTINHAIRFTAPQTCDGYLYPARHEAGSGSCASRPPMGLRVRLRADVDIGGFGPQSQVILTALKTYGMLLADNGSAWYITGAPDPGWDDDELHDLHAITGADFEVVDTTGFVNG